jgi:hypothetical protein
MISKRELSEEEKAKRIAAKQKKKQEMFKEFKFGTRISSHDVEIKVRNIRHVLTKGITTRVFVEARRRKGMSAAMFEEELEKRGVMLGDITKKLKDVGSRTSKVPNKIKKGAVMAEFKPLPSAVEAVSQGAEASRDEEVESEGMESQHFGEEMASSPNEEAELKSDETDESRPDIEESSKARESEGASKECQGEETPTETT